MIAQINSCTCVKIDAQKNAYSSVTWNGREKGKKTETPKSPPTEKWINTCGIIIQWHMYSSKNVWRELQLEQILHIHVEKNNTFIQILHLYEVKKQIKLNIRSIMSIYAYDKMKEMQGKLSIIFRMWYISYLSFNNYPPKWFKIIDIYYLTVFVG